MTGELTRSRRRRALRGGLLPVAIVIVALALAACGGSGGSSGGSSSGKPSYCAKIDGLRKSVSDLADINVILHGTGGVRKAFDRVRSSANAVFDALRSDFSGETSALSTSITDLGDTVNKLSSSPLTAVPAIPGHVSAVRTAVTKLIDATRSRCS